MKKRYGPASADLNTKIIRMKGEGMSTLEIAKELGITVSGVSNRLNRIRKGTTTLSSDYPTMKVPRIVEKKEQPLIALIGSREEIQQTLRGLFS